jgi:hypothetical protein
MSKGGEGNWLPAFQSCDVVGPLRMAELGVAVLASKELDGRVVVQEQCDFRP